MARHLGTTNPKSRGFTCNFEQVFEYPHRSLFCFLFYMYLSLFPPHEFLLVPARLVLRARNFIPRPICDVWHYTQFLEFWTCVRVSPTYLTLFYMYLSFFPSWISTCVRVPTMAIRLSSTSLKFRGVAPAYVWSLRLYPISGISNMCSSIHTCLCLASFSKCTFIHTGLYFDSFSKFTCLFFPGYSCGKDLKIE